LRGLAIAVLVLGLGVCARGTEPPPMDNQPKGTISQWAVDPFDPNQGWALGPDGLMFNPELKGGGQWTTKFNRNTYRRTRGTEPRSLDFLKVLPSKKKKGNLFLMLGTESTKAQIFFTSDYGDRWSYLGTRDRTATPGEDSGGKSEGAVDLSSLNASGGSAGGSSTASAPPSSGPQFKIYFDFLLTSRPGVTPLTFDNYHYFVLVDFIPKPGIQFSFDLSPTPRYYQLEYDITPRLGFYIGRIMVPFDDMTPHNRFGGYLNNSKTAAPGAPAFLPDIWADLGLGIKYKLLDVSNLTVLTHVYVVNGFTDTGIDPVTNGSSYPNFGNQTGTDNNSDKAIGARLQADFFQTVSFVFSFYTANWSPAAAATSTRVNILGAHARFRPTPSTQARLGYIFFSSDLPSTANGTTFQRGGLYGELRQKFGPFWYASVDGGVLQTDNRIIDQGDQLNVGGRLGYFTGMFDVSVQYRHDLKAVASKTSRDYMAARLSINL
jgi:hypothetical protein